MTSSVDTSIRVRIDSGTKARAQEKLAQMGLTISDAVRMFLVRIDEDGRFPFVPEVPNSRLRKTMAEQEAGIGTKQFATAAELFDDLGI
ncbi:MAG: type II toxin-antitoxin system RelB/DinJ family antitoxin [Pyramidobacter sp.]|nr:type II toxin-antitoxin system RelB/DinJ family antitoxin [Pyramidobacter sp.]